MHLSNEQLAQQWRTEMRLHAESLPIFKQMSERLRNLCYRAQLYSMQSLTAESRRSLLAREKWGVVSVNELEQLLALHRKKLKKDRCKECGQWL